MRARAGPPRRALRRAALGGAAVEVLLSVPFLFLFAIAIVDFTRGMLVGARAHRAARHVAWCEGRKERDDDHPGAPEAEEMNAFHFAGGAGDVGVSSAHEEVQSFFGSDAPAEGSPEAANEAFGAFGVNLNDVGRGVVGFFLGTVDVERGTVTKAIVDTRPMFAGGDLVANHWVGLDSRPEEDAEDPRGWWDPFRDIKDKISKLFD